MSIDELKNEWSTAGIQAAPEIKLDAAGLKTSGAQRIRHSLRWSSAGAAIELLLNLIAVVALGEFVAARVLEPRFLLPGLALDFVAIASLISNVRQLVRSRRVDLGGDLLQVQTALQRLALERIQVTLGTLLVAPLLWTPLLIVCLRALGIDAYAALGNRYLLINLLFGAALIPIAVWVSRRYAAQMTTSPRLRHLLDQLAGYSLVRAQAALRELTAES